VFGGSVDGKETADPSPTGSDRSVLLTAQALLPARQTTGPSPGRGSPIQLTALNGNASLPFCHPEQPTCLRQVKGEMNGSKRIVIPTEAYSYFLPWQEIGVAKRRDLLFACPAKNLFIRSEAEGSAVFLTPRQGSLLRSQTI
jgi:hypothetical protein